MIFSSAFKKNSLATWLFIPTAFFVVTLILAVAIATFVIFHQYSLSQVAEAKQNSAEQLYNILDQSFTTATRDNAGANHFVYKADSMANMETYSRDQIVQMQLYEDGELIYEVDNRAIIQSRSFTGEARILKLWSNIFTIDHSFSLSFKPWKWRVNFVLDDSAYYEFMEKALILFLCTATLLTLCIIGFVLFLSVIISNPLNKLIRAVQEGEISDYTGIREFSFLSNTVNTFIIERLEKEKALKNAKENAENENIKQLLLASNVLKNIAEGVVVTNTEAQIISVNKAVIEITGYSEEELLGQNPSLWKSQHHDDAFYKDMWKSLTTTRLWHGEIWNRRKNGDVYPSQMTITGLNDEHGNLINYVSVFSDITTSKESQKRLKQLARYDQLTQLPNRHLMIDRLNQALKTSERRNTSLGLLLLDLDGFKEVNDSLGHKSGDILLIEVGRRLLQCVRESDTVARLGGDEFVVLLPDCMSSEMVIKVVKKILDNLVEPFDLQGEEAIISASIGATMYPDDGIDADTLMKNADTAMYHVKERGKKGFQFFTSSMQEHIEQRLQLISQLRYAMEREEFVLLYQPKMNLATGKISGMEALIRWQHPDKGMISPADFIPLAEETGLIISLGEWVLSQACQQVEVWKKEGLESLRVSVNLSARQFQDKELVSMVKDVIQKTGIEPSLLELEITETTIMRHIERTVDVLWQLRDLGLLLSIDDFGTGYSSLSYIKNFPLDILKIDRSFVVDITSNPNDRAVVEAIISLAHHLKLKVIAEGVETEEQLLLLNKRKCHEIQGYFLAKPLTVEEFGDFIRKHRSSIN